MPCCAATVSANRKAEATIKLPPEFHQMEKKFHRLEKKFHQMEFKFHRLEFLQRQAFLLLRLLLVEQSPDINNYLKKNVSLIPCRAFR